MVNLKNLLDMKDQNLTIEINNKTDNIIIIDWKKISQDESQDYQDIHEYYLDEESAQEIDQKNWTPFGILGLTHNPDSFAEMSHGGLLVIDQKGHVIHILNGQTKVLAKDLSDLKIGRYQPKRDKNETHRDPPYEEMWDEAMSLRSDKKFEDAIQILEKLSQSLPDNSEVMMDLAITHYKNDDLNKCSEIAEKVLETEPNFIKALATKASVLIKENNFSEALQIAEKIIAMHNPEDDFDEEPAKGYALRAVIMSKTGQLEKAKEDKKRALEIDSLVKYFVDGLKDIK